MVDGWLFIHQIKQCREDSLLLMDLTQMLEEVTEAECSKVFLEYLKQVQPLISTLGTQELIGLLNISSHPNGHLTFHDLRGRLGISFRLKFQSATAAILILLEVFKLDDVFCCQSFEFIKS